MAQKDNLIRDSFAVCIAGMNSDPAPILLSKDQASMATNMTFRGGFARNRPPIRRMTLDFGGDVVLQSLVERNLFQGASYYKPDYGFEQLVAHIAGRLFTFTPDPVSLNVTVRDVTIPGNPNSATSLQAWLWQSELFLIAMDGQNLPVFYDGTTSRRSFGPAQALAVTAAPFNAPAKGAQVSVTLNAVYTGQYNIPVLVDGAQYTLLQSASGQPNARLQQLSAPAPVNVQIGAQVLVIPSRVGTLNGNLPQLRGALPGCSNSGIGHPNTANVSASAAASNNGTDNIVAQPRVPGPDGIVVTPTTPIVSIGTDSYQLTHVSGVSGTPFVGIVSQIGLAKLNCGVSAHSIGEVITTQNNAPNTLIGAVAVAFVNPGYAATVDVVLDTAYTGGPQIVWIGDIQYIISQVPIPTSATVALVNVNDNPGDLIGAGTDIFSIPELPAGRMGAYGLGRNAVSLLDGRSFMMGDIVGSSSGTVTYNNRDAVLRSTENTFLAGGGNFAVPGTVGSITSMTFAATLDSSLGQGPLQVGTPTIMFSCSVPVDRTVWQAVTNPILTESLKGQGPTSQWSTINLNSDIGFRSPIGWASLILARREFDTWGNVGQSTEVNRITDLDDPALLNYSSAIDFDNRMLLTCFPTKGVLGVYHQGLIALNFDPISSLRGKAASIYDGLWTGLNVLQLIEGLFSGVNRAFAFCYNSFESRIELFEILPTRDSNIYDNGSNPISMSMETPVFFKPDDLNRAPYLRLEDGEITVDKVYGVVTFQVWYRPEFDSCWHPWITWSVCSGNDSTIPQWRPKMGFGSPPSGTDACDPVTNRPFCEGKFFQLRIQVTGACEVKNIGLAASVQPLPQYAPPICKPLCESQDNETDCEPCKTLTECLQFPLVFYSLNNNKSYSNPLLSFEVVCPNGSTRNITVPAGTITFTLPFPVGFQGEYPPLVLACGSSYIVRYLTAGATQDEIDAIVEGMIVECARATAESEADCTVIYTNQTVYVVHACSEGETLSYSGTLPPWITIDTGNSRLVGAAGTYAATTQEEADALAQSALNDFASTAIANGDLTCESGPTLIIENYVDGLIGNPVVDPPTTQTLWDGKFVYQSPNNNWKASDNSSELFMDDNILCNAYISEATPWRLEFWDNSGNQLWVGENTDDVSPLGIYTRSGGTELGPATLTIIGNPDPILSTGNSQDCLPI